MCKDAIYYRNIMKKLAEKKLSRNSIDKVLYSFWRETEIFQLLSYERERNCYEEKHRSLEENDKVKVAWTIKYQKALNLFIENIKLSSDNDEELILFQNLNIDKLINLGINDLRKSNASSKNKILLNNINKDISEDNEAKLITKLDKANKEVNFDRSKGKFTYDKLGEPSAKKSSVSLISNVNTTTLSKTNRKSSNSSSIINKDDKLFTNPNSNNNNLVHKQSTPCSKFSNKSSCNVNNANLFNNDDKGKKDNGIPSSFTDDDQDEDDRKNSKKKSK